MKNKKQKICRNNTETACSTRPAVALLVVLFIVMAITVLTLGYLSKSDTELAAGENVKLKTQLDYLAESGLEHARGLLLYPKGVDLQGNDYWPGASGQQLVSGDDYYDVNIVYTDTNDANSYYLITSTAYREVDSVRIAQSTMAVQIPLNMPAPVKYWKLDDGSGTEVIDSSTENNPGELQGLGWAWDTGLFSGAVNFGQASPSGNVILYEDKNYGGWAASFSGIGIYRLSDIVDAGGQNNDAESIRVPAGYKVTLYDNDPPGGSTAVKTSDDNNLGDFKNDTSSLEIELVGGYVEGDAALSKTGSATVSLWVCIPVSYESWGPIATIVCNNDDYEVAINDSAQLFIAHVDSGGSDYLAGPLTTAMNDNQWHHVLFTLNSTDSEVKLYVDGELEDTGTSYSDDYNAKHFYLGYRDQLPNEYYTGKIDEVLVYDAVLNQIQVSYLASQ